MKKIVSLLMVLAMLMALVPAAFAAEETAGEVIASGSNVKLESTGNDIYDVVTVEWTAPSNGTLNVHIISAAPGWHYTVEGVTVKKTGRGETSHDYTVTADTAYVITLGCYINWSDAAGVISYELTFTPDEGEVVVQKEDYIISDTAITGTGSHVIDMEYAHMTVVEFTPKETGVYTVTVNGETANIAYVGGGSFFILSKDAVSWDSKLEWTCQEVAGQPIVDDNGTTYYSQGQSAMIGIVSEAETVTLTVEKTGDFERVEIPTVEYENKAQLSKFQLPEGAVIGDYVDVYGQAHTAVLGEDGYYHLDSATGPILLVDMDYLAVLSDALGEGRGVMYVYSTDANDNEVRYDIANAIQAYEAVCDENCYYPLTEDLMFFYAEYAVQNGVPQYVLEEDYNEDCAWMFACVTMTVEEADDNNQENEHEDEKPVVKPDKTNPETGDNTVICLAAAAMVVSAMSIALLPAAKKEFF